MRWKKNQVGDFRIKEKFLFLPKCISNEYRWLEFAKWKEEYVVEYWGSKRLYIWIATEWLD